MPDSFKLLSGGDENYCIWHQTGKNNKAKVVKSYEQEDIDSGKVKITEFITDIATAYQWADVVICRAGALTVSELAMAGTPAIFVPLPHAVDDHQTKNALYLVNSDAAKLLPQAKLTNESVTKLITELFERPETLADMAKASLNAANSDASQKVAKLCQQLSQSSGAELRNNEEKI